ncbi:sensor histidine kinase [Caenispirillum bisanense]|uniref:histidine kinase n=1 Tax=Caenispirillum bisanense TaxID=414052 RepID=A0A286GZA1_9PROT|nr:histidine kinase dimerization/phosphoacceptor domain -containing protein [Caenispirillum bisanense]SOE00792.1 Two-component sensor histidine kinase, contains HisKA and HATPase domains [Caenispirillum bisanense]
MSDDVRLLDALDEPALLLTAAGLVHHANAAARRFFRDSGVAPPEGRPLASLVLTPPDRLQPMLDGFARSGRPLVGSVEFRGPQDAPLTCPVRGCRVTLRATPWLLLRLQVAEAMRFRALTETTVRLNAELAENKRIRRRLEAALAEKEVLLRELNHRVKNNLQILQGILGLSERSATDDRVRLSLAAVRQRVEAMGVVQRLLYHRGDVTRLDGPEFLENLVGGAVNAFGRPHITIDTASEPVEISAQAAFLIGLVVNELLVNALKYAFPDRTTGRIAVRLALLADGRGLLRLQVEDDGIGLKSSPATGTGLVLVRRLVGAAGGTFEMHVDGGTRCTVVFRDPSAVAK